MKRARIVHGGRPEWAIVENDGEMLRLGSGQSVVATDAIWLPPVVPGGTIFALGLNYADHTKELGFAKQETPLVFLKGHETFTGHNGSSYRPADANQMHPECELVAIIGAPARRVRQADAMRYVSGYTIACDYAIREYLENYYRPNLRVKNRDAATPIGPWIIDAADIADPQALSLETKVNGSIVQHGSTADMVFTIAWLIEYLSSFMTLSPGDMILTGTPHGVHFVDPGDDVVCSIGEIGSLSHKVVAA